MASMTAAQPFSAASAAADAQDEVRTISGVGVGIPNGFIGQRMCPVATLPMDRWPHTRDSVVIGSWSAKSYPSVDGQATAHPNVVSLDRQACVFAGLVACDAAVVQRFRERFAGRLVTGCVYQRQPPATRGVLIERVPRFAGPHAHYAEWWPGIAPSPLLREAQRSGRIPWASFAARYRAELDHWPGGLLLLWRHLATLLERHPTVTLLGVAPAAGGDERRAACARRVLWAWLLGDEEASRVAAA